MCIVYSLEIEQEATGLDVRPVGKWFHKTEFQEEMLALSLKFSTRLGQ